MTPKTGKRIAVMQPYLFPYLGYFRLLAQADEFVLLDCVQFPRSGRVHRSEIGIRDGQSQWLTLPLARQAREVRIQNLAFATDARVEFDRRLASLPGWADASGPAAPALRTCLSAPLGSVVDFLQDGLSLVRDLLGLDTPLLRSSSLDIDPALSGQERILAICQARAAGAYLNAPGGRELYAPDAFARQGIELQFLPPYQGRFMHLLPALLREDPRDLAEELRDPPKVTRS